MWVERLRGKDGVDWVGEGLWRISQRGNRDSSGIWMFWLVRLVGMYGLIKVEP